MVVFEAEVSLALERLSLSLSPCAKQEETRAPRSDGPAGAQARALERKEAERRARERARKNESVERRVVVVGSSLSLSLSPVRLFLCVRVCVRVLDTCACARCVKEEKNACVSLGLWRRRERGERRRHT